MRELTVTVDSNHLARYVGAPRVAIQELIWNSLDADAMNVVVHVERSPSGSIDGVSIADDGHGISDRDCDLDFSRFGASWKSSATGTRSEKRQLHGSKGRGRFAAFGLGEVVTWRTRYEGVDGTLYEYEIKGQGSTLGHFQVEDSRVSQPPTGTTVTIYQPTTKALNFLSRTDLQAVFAPEFALYLTIYPQVSIAIDGSNLDPTALQRECDDLEDLGILGAEDMRLKIVHWNCDIDDPAIYLCHEDGVVASKVILPTNTLPNRNVTAYAYWHGFTGSDDLDAALEIEPTASILRRLTAVVTDTLKESAPETEARLVDEWIADGVYPFEVDNEIVGVPAIERETFNRLAVLTAPELGSQSKKQKKLTFRLLWLALQARPDAIEAVLKEVLNLSDERVAALAGLLERTSLGSIIETSSKITSRLDFLKLLELIVWDDEANALVNERDHLHKMMAAEPWVFEEEYAVSASDVGVNRVLAAHAMLLGSEVAVDLTPRIEFSGRPDLVLSRTVQYRNSEIRHLVVELKRPSVTLGIDELDQLRKYALKISREPRFNQPQVRWDFWVIGVDLDEDARSMIKMNQPIVGMYETLANDQIALRARTWAEVIGDARYRLQFVQDSLNADVSDVTALNYMRATHSQHLPEGLFPTTDR